MLKVVILTSKENGYASSVVPLLAASDKVELAAVIYCPLSRKSLYKKISQKFKKIKRIGILAAINGYRMRGWYVHDGAENLSLVCSKHRVPLLTFDNLYNNDLSSYLSSIDVDLGLSLGNGYIPKKVFGAPSRGFINIHTEILPNYKNAQSIIWPIHNGERLTGFTVHKVEEIIDGGDILYQETYPIKFERSLESTVRESLRTAYARVPLAFLAICEDFARFERESFRQGRGGSYTTPTISQFKKMVKQNQKAFSATEFKEKGSRRANNAE